jgi:hypothetical protein
MLFTSRCSSIIHRVEVLIFSHPLAGTPLLPCIRRADMVAKIMRGTKAGDIPMEQPTTYELAVNARTAKALGIRVDRVIDH